MIVFYEKKHAEELLKKGFITSFMSYVDLSILARYFKHIGKNKAQIREDLIKFCERYNPDFNEILSWNKVKNAVNSIDKKILLFPMDVSVTESEIDTIKSMGDYKIQRIVFVLLVIAKYFKYNDNNIKPRKLNKYSDNFYANVKIPDLLRLANVKVDHDEFTHILYNFDKDNLARITITLSQSFQINFIDEDSPVSIIITDMNRIGNFYPYFCDNCGRKIEKKAKKHCFCEECYKEFRRESWAKSKRKIRKDDKNRDIL